MSRRFHLANPENPHAFPDFRITFDSRDGWCGETPEARPYCFSKVISGGVSSGGNGMKQRVMGLVLMTLLIAMSASAQQGTTELRGRVIDPQGAVLPGVTVVVRNQETGMFRETTSGSDGTFISSGLVPGTYQVNE